MAEISTRPVPSSKPTLSLVAAASRRDIKSVKPGESIKQEAWQARLWDFYRSLGAVHYGVNFKKNAAGKIRYFAAELDPEDPDGDPVETENEAALAAVARLRSRFGGLKEIVAEFVVHLSVPGEGYLVGRDGLEGEEWDVWSIDEAERARNPAGIVNADAAEGDSGSFTARIWRPDPQDRTKADSPLRPVAQQCEQLLLLEDSVGALAKSRLSAGFFYLPSELDIGDEKEFEEEMIAVLTTPIKESDSAARWAPGLIRGPAAYYNQLGPITFSREIDSTFAAMRDELTGAIAAGLDLPAEIILGKTDLNHWTAWEIDESAFRDHIDPDILLVLDSMTRGYLRPALEAAKVENPENFLIWRDLSDLGQRPPSIAEATALFDRGIVSSEYMRGLINATDDDAPIEAPAAPATEVDAEPQPGAPEVEVIVAAVDEANSRPLTELTLIDRVLLERISEAADSAFNRVLERAGAKIRSHAKRDRAILATIESTPNERVSRLLGERLVAQLQITPAELVPEGSFDQLQRRLRDMFKSAAAEVAARLEAMTGEKPVFDDSRREAAIVTFLAALSALAVRLLFRPTEPEPGEVADTVVPAGMIVDMMTEAGGSAVSSGPSTNRGFASGSTATSFLSQHGIRVAAHRWEYGDASTRAQPFPPHRALDQVEFDDWTDERLATPATASWLSVNFMFPGDHRGCRCLTVPVVVFPMFPSSDVAA